MQSNYDADDATDVESVETEFYGEESAEESEDGKETYGFDDDESDDDREEIYSSPQQNYTVLNEHDIRQRQEDDINRVSNVLSTSRAHACLLLQHYNWSVSKVHEEWFADEESVCKAIGLLGKPVEIPDGRELICGICFEVYPWREMSTASCGHLFCNSCWGGYIGTAINDGPGCLSLRCPHPSCSAAIGQDMFDVLASCEDKEKYYHYLFRSYIENNRKIKWCPAPGCELAIDFVMGCGIYDVSCNCSYSFCWNCTEEAHRPVECCTVAKWILKNNAESENIKWIMANSKPCPKCKRPIEKHSGCMHMTCRPPCKFEFCWLCLEASAQHRGSCNRYENTKERVTDESGKWRERSKNSLERYTHYYERWASNQQSGQKAQADLHSMKTQKMFEKLSKSQALPKTQLNFITDAMLQVIECRRILKWTYAYGYFLPHEHAKKQFFEYLQGEAEAGLERLHRCAEKELQVFLDNEVPMNKFKEFRIKLLQLTSVTRKYFENLVQVLESGLKDVEHDQQTDNNDDDDDDDDSGSSSSTVDMPDWSCKRCTYDNPFCARKCQMCAHRKSK